MRKRTSRIEIRPPIKAQTAPPRHHKNPAKDNTVPPNKTKAKSTAIRISSAGAQMVSAQLRAGCRCAPRATATEETHPRREIPATADAPPKRPIRILSRLVIRRESLFPCRIFPVTNSKIPLIRNASANPGRLMEMRNKEQNVYTIASGQTALFTIR